MDEFEKIIKELKKNEFVAELSNGKMYISKKFGNDVILSELKKNEDFLMDSMAGVKILGKAGALLLVHANVCGVFASVITEEAAEILEYFAVETEYENKIQKISRDKCPMYYERLIEWDEEVKDVEDPLEAFEKLSKLF